MAEYEEQKKADEKAGIIEINEDLLKQLLDMGLDEIGSKKSLIATKNDISKASDYYWEHINDLNFNTDVSSCNNNGNHNNKPSSSSSSSSVVSNIVDVTKVTATTGTATGTARGKQGKKKKPRYIPLELQRLFTQLQHLDQCAISTEGKYATLLFHTSRFAVIHTYRPIVYTYNIPVCMHQIYTHQ